MCVRLKGLWVRPEKTYRLVCLIHRKVLARLSLLLGCVASPGPISEIQYLNPLNSFLGFDGPFTWDPLRSKYYSISKGPCGKCARGEIAVFVPSSDVRRVTCYFGGRLRRPSRVGAGPAEVGPQPPSLASGSGRLAAPRRARRPAAPLLPLPPVPGPSTGVSRLEAVQPACGALGGVVSGRAPAPRAARGGGRPGRRARAPPARRRLREGGGSRAGAPRLGAAVGRPGPRGPRPRSAERFRLPSPPRPPPRAGPPG